MAPTPSAISVHVLNNDIQTVAILANAQWQRFPVHRSILGSLRQQFHRHIDLHRVFKGLYDLARKRRHTPEDIDGAAFHTVLVLERDVAVLYLNRDWNQHGVARNLHKVRSHIKGHQVDGDLVPDYFFQVLELYGRSRLQFGELFQTVKLLGLPIIIERRLAQLLDTTVGEAARLARHPHLLVQRQPRIRGVLQGVFFRAVHRHVIVAAHAAIDELDYYFLPNPLEVAIAPLLERESGGFAAAFVHRALVAAAGGVGLDLIRGPKHDVSAAAVGLPPGDASRVVFVGIRDTPVVLFFKLVLFGVRRGIAALPEGFNELVALFVVRELHEGGFLFVGDYPAHILVQPLPISLAQLNLQRFGIGLPLFFRDRAL